MITNRTQLSSNNKLPLVDEMFCLLSVITVYVMSHGEHVMSHGEHS